MEQLTRGREHKRNPVRSAILINMLADRVEISWDVDKRKWLVRIEVGSEVIRRYCDQPRNADEHSLRAAAEKTVVDEGYQFASANISVRANGLS